MKIATILAMALGLAGAVQAGPDSFPYIQWTNNAGNSFEARFDHIDADKVVLRAKKGGKRYPVKRDTLSKESEDLLGAYQGEATKKINAIKNDPAAAVPVELAYRSVALGLTNKLTSLNGRRIEFAIDKIRVKDRLSAILELDGNCIRVIKPPKGREFFLKNDNLYHRPAQKDNRIPYPKRMNADARLMYERGGTCAVTLSAGMNISWDSVGVSDGPVFR